MNATDVHRPLGRAGEPPSWGRDYGIRELWTEVAPNLWVGGTDDDDTVRAARSGRSGLVSEAVSVELERARYFEASITRDHFDAVCSLYPQSLPVGKGVAEYRYAFDDGPLDPTERDELLEAVAWVGRRWAKGDRVLVRCQAGLNRSSYVAALALIAAGWKPAEAIGAIRRRRSAACLFNGHFEAELLTQRAGELR